MIINAATAQQPSRLSQLVRHWLNAFNEFLGLQNKLEDKMDEQQMYVKKSFMHIISMFSTNIEFQNSYFRDKYKLIFETSELIMGSLNVISTPVISMLFLTVIIFTKVNSTIFLLVFIFTNYFPCHYA